MPDGCVPAVVDLVPRRPGLLLASGMSGHAFKLCPALGLGAAELLLDPGDASHTPMMSDNGKYFVDNASRVNLAPKSVLYDRNGTQVMDLESTDVAALMEAGFKMPEPFQVKADDGLAGRRWSSWTWSSEPYVRGTKRTAQINTPPIVASEIKAHQNPITLKTTAPHTTPPTIRPRSWSSPRTLSGCTGRTTSRPAC